MHRVHHRGLRELYAMTRRLGDHWRALAGRLEVSAPQHALLLLDGSDVARALLAELTEVTAERGIYGGLTAQGIGAQLARVHNGALDTSLEINQALRFAVLDVVHVVTLLEFLARAAAQDGDPPLEAFLAGWATQLRGQEQAIRAAAVELGVTPELAVRASCAGVAGRIGHGAASLLGTFGEWVDRRAAR
jgi:hypothetical protein